MYIDRKKQKAIRLSISQVDEKKIELGIQQIATCIMELYEKNNYNSVSFKPYL
ncbi:hypothetical protein ACRS6K_15495 [Bacillus cytotoxicus]|nr:hypothetical protein [Bacillus cytotoxicus]MDH2893346.1 hypothetical protein [Bacillus cytotoxicus]